MFLRLVSLAAALVLLSACNEKKDLTPLTITTENGEVVYEVETAVTREEMAQGLMDRKSLAENSGMIFNIGGETQMAMWMKDTYIPLDMIFVNQEGEIIWIFENAEPLSTTFIRPVVSEPIWKVIELNAGQVEKHGIKIGDRIDIK